MSHFSGNTTTQDLAQSLRAGDCPDLLKLHLCRSGEPCSYLEVD